MDLAEQYILYALIFVWEFLWSRGPYWITIHFAQHSEVCLLSAPASAGRRNLRILDIHPECPESGRSSSGHMVPPQ